MKSSMEPVEASWTVELNCDCPKCGEYVNLLDYADFWDGRRALDVGFNTDDGSEEVVCPECSHEFEITITNF